MMKAIKIIMMSMGLLAAAGCSDMHIEEPELGPVLTVSVTDPEGTPIEHIQVTLDWTDAGIKEVSFTSSDGTLKTPAYLSAEGDTSLTVTLEDIDGEENGGLFETATENITLFEKDASDSLTDNSEISLEMVFHLYHATL